MMRKISLILLACAVYISQFAQQSEPFDVLLEATDLQGIPGLQSYAFGVSDGKWLVFGGRIDGLHRRQPFASFDAEGKNEFIYVIDPISGETWSQSLEAYPSDVKEQMGSTNLQFEQEGNTLYITGGYGYSESQDEHITHARLLAVDVATLMNSVIESNTCASCIRILENNLFAVTGGHLDKIGSVYYLVGGQKFTGRYNPMAPDFGPGFEQEYTNQIRKFTIQDDGINLNITELEHLTNETYLHRRDFNVVAQIMPNGEQGLTAFSGVFQIGADIPYLHCVNIDGTGYYPNPDFAQYLNHYHCAVLPLYSAESNEMHNIFFGGIAQYFMEGEELVQDSEVPFVRTVSRVTRDSEGTMTEYNLPIEMPDWLGAGAELIINQNLPTYENGVIKMDEISGDSILIGYIYGGIHSTAANIFWDNEGDLSSAANLIYKVYISKNSITGQHELNKQSNGGLRMQVYPNPNDGNFNIHFNLTETSDVSFVITTLEGKEVARETLKQLEAGDLTITQWIDGLSSGGTYVITLITSKERAQQKVIVKP
ncbi:MAG: T9SS type A sorting domain-containing protein [Flavobacteriales bacterium]|nr:T9SS type A sorting domain-containing protein [Flavobacteriales bacterium]